jgi:adenosylhomocysteine nucleosidase
MTWSFATKPGGGTSGVTAIVSAMPEELAALRRQLWGSRRLRGGHDFTTGWLGRAPVALAVTGDGERNAYDGLCSLLCTLEVRRVLVVGVSGALSQALELGSLLVSERVLQEGGEQLLEPRVLDPEEALVEAASRLCVASRAVLISARQLADTPAEKRRLLELLDARDGNAPILQGPPSGARGVRLAAVDLESAAYARAAVEAGVPWLCVRAISDTAEEALPALLNRCRDGGGAVQRGRVARGLLREPRTVPALLSLRQRVRRCAGVLERAAQALILDWAEHMALEKPVKGTG